MFKIAVICGGPSPERGISLNSARSVLDHLSSQSIEIVPIYVDHQLHFYSISPAQLYSNTPSDFDFKLTTTAKALDRDQLLEELKNVNLVFPVIHGAFGEDGRLQFLLEELNIPYVGSNSKSCFEMYSKNKAKELLAANGFPTLPSILLESNDQLESRISTFFTTHQLVRAIIKPNQGGSSIGVSSVSSVEEACARYHELSSRFPGIKFMLEPFCNGSEFTVLVLQNRFGKPIALVPTEIEMDYSHGNIFDYRKKYLPTNQVFFHTPARYSTEVIQNIRNQAQTLFSLFEARDFVRIDGWVTSDGAIYFTDFNPISGMEQNSFLFRQSSCIGLTHHQTLLQIIKSACHRQHIHLNTINVEIESPPSPVHVLLGGKNAERQISLMSGTNVWLKLLRSSKYSPKLFFYDTNGDVWNIPYTYALNHTVEEVMHNCLSSIKSDHEHLIEQIKIELDSSYLNHPQACKFSMNEFLSLTKKESAYLFIALHGGEGENGTLQKILEDQHIRFNGSCSIASKLCMNKYETADVIRSINHPDLTSLPKRKLPKSSYDADLRSFWDAIVLDFNTTKILAKPMCDGCSAGIVVLNNFEDLKKYVNMITSGFPTIPAGTFLNQTNNIEMPRSSDGEFILEPYIETDSIVIHHNQMHHTFKQGWLELTVGLLEKDGIYRIFNPSITIAEGAVLSLEEKFQGGTGINLTPPPESLFSEFDIKHIKELIKIAAKYLKIKNYARIDIFYNLKTKKLIVIEANSLPALTPSTVIYHQALAEKPPLSPLKLIEEIVSTSQC